MTTAMVCDKCGKKMLRCTAEHYLTYPPKIHYVWHCGCGNSVDGGCETQESDEHRFMREWRAINRGAQVSD